MTALKRTTSALLLTPDAKLVLQLRDNRPGIPYPRHWATLGGRIEGDETPEQGMWRELVEEIEFVPPVRYWRVFDHSYPFDGETVQVENHAFVGYLDRPLEQINLLEGERLQAFTLAELDQIPLAFNNQALVRGVFTERPLIPQFKRVGPELAEVVHQVMQRAFNERAQQVPPPKALTESVAAVRQGILDGGAVVGWWDGQPIASGRFLLDGAGWYVRRVSVLPAYRRMGIGSALMLYLEGLARAAGQQFLRLNTRKSNHANNAFYQQLGFTVVGEETYPDGREVSLTFRKDLMKGWS